MVLATHISASSAQGSGATRDRVKRDVRGSARGASPVVGLTRPPSPSVLSAPSRRSDRRGEAAMLTTARGAPRRGRTEPPAPAPRVIAPYSPSVPAVGAGPQRLRRHSHTPEIRASHARRPRSEAPPTRLVLDLQRPSGARSARRASWVGLLVARAMPSGPVASLTRSPTSA